MDVESKRTMAGILAILLGGFGAHKFALGYTTPGMIMLLVGILGLFGFVTGFCCYIPWILCFANLVMSTIGLIEGIMYLTKTDEEFIETYQIGEKQWF